MGQHRCVVKIKAEKERWDNKCTANHLQPHKVQEMKKSKRMIGRHLTERDKMKLNHKQH